MRELDEFGRLLAEYQANIFLNSAEEFSCSSPVFIRRFMKSDFAYFLDKEKMYQVDELLGTAFDALKEQYGDKGYGHVKWPEPVMEWIGYFSRYVCYTRQLTSAAFYQIFSMKDLARRYCVYHTQDFEWGLDRLKEWYHYNEDDLDRDLLLKKFLRASRDGKDKELLRFYTEQKARIDKENGPCGPLGY